MAHPSISTRTAPLLLAGLLTAACTESPTQPALLVDADSGTEVQPVVATLMAPPEEISGLKIAVEDALMRLLPSLEESVETESLRGALLNVDHAIVLGQAPGLARAVESALQQIRVLERQEGVGTLADLAALQLVLDRAEALASVPTSETQLDHRTQ